MPDVFLYQVKVFVPGAGPSDAILLDVEKYNPPYYKEGKHGEEVKFTPKELGIHFVSKGMKPSKKGLWEKKSVPGPDKNRFSS